MLLTVLTLAGFGQRDSGQGKVGCVRTGLEKVAKDVQRLEGLLWKGHLQ